MFHFLVNISNYNSQFQLIKVVVKVSNHKTKLLKKILIAGIRLSKVKKHRRTVFGKRAFTPNTRLQLSEGKENT